jgi:O-acetyl-ADP-ribose deacetylase (regulator of RNase III)
MIQYKTGDVLNVTTGLIIHGCNAKGVMGSGVALAVKLKYPKVYDTYKRTEQLSGLRLGGCSIRGVNPELAVANLITQEFYGRDLSIKYVSYGALHLGFENLHTTYPITTTFHFPKIGSGLGNGDWRIIASLIELACPGRELVCWMI